MTSAEFRDAGRALFDDAPYWHDAMARLLSVNTRTVQRWAAGQNPIPEAVAAMVAALLETTEAARNRDV